MKIDVHFEKNNKVSIWLNSWPIDIDGKEYELGLMKEGMTLRNPANLENGQVYVNLTNVILEMMRLLEPKE